MVNEQNQQFQKLYNLYEKYRQHHVFKFWHQLENKQKDRFLRQLESIDLELIEQLGKKFITNPKGSRQQTVELLPADVIPVPQIDEQIQNAGQARKLGEELLRSGKVGIILVAGGQGTRLGFSGPKGKFPITPVRNKSLFQNHGEKIIALSKKYQTILPWYIMTSEVNHGETKDFFSQNNYFGLNPSDVLFFQQQMIPGVDDNGKLFLEQKDRLFTNPNGHGGTFQALFKSGALEDLARRGIEELFYFQVDNVLVQICDPIFLGYHLQAKTEMSSKVLSKRDPYEKVGVLGFSNGKLTVIEYSDLSNEELVARNPDGTLKFDAGSIAIHMINRYFIEKLIDNNRLPYHLAVKKISYIDDFGKTVSPSKPNGFKFEMFIFDALQYTTNSVVMEVDRKVEFSPVKNAEGEDSSETAQRDLCNMYGDWLKSAGVKIEKTGKNDNLQGKLEISPLFAINKEEFIAKCPEGLKFYDGLYLE